MYVLLTLNNNNSMSSIQATIFNQPSGKVLGSGTGAVAAAQGATTIILPTQSADTTIPYNTTTGAFTIPYTGRYMVSALISFTGATTGYLSLYAANNIQDVLQGRVAQVNVSAANISGSNIYTLTKGQVVNLSLYLNTAANISFYAQDTWWCINKV